tara:strand:+ start:281 stop:568 length:288 start_codon:yes stop_codon:yes gene_type:complete
MPSNHISNKPYHDWLAATYKQRKQESKMTKPYDHEEAIDRAIDIANEINIHQLQCILANWEDRITIYDDHEPSKVRRIKGINTNGGRLQLNVIDE